MATSRRVALIEDVKANEGERPAAASSSIRQEGVRRERPLLLETLKSLRPEETSVWKGRRVLDGSGNPSDGLCLNEAIEKATRDSD